MATVNIKIIGNRSNVIISNPDKYIIFQEKEYRIIPNYINRRCINANKIIAKIIIVTLRIRQKIVKSKIIL